MTKKPSLLMPQTSGKAPIIDAIDAHGDPMTRAMRRRYASYAELPGLGDIRADRSIPIRSRRHSVRHNHC